MTVVFNLLISALFTVITKLFSAKLAEKVMRKALINALEFIVASTHNTVDDDMAAPIIEALKEQDDGL